MEFDWLNTIQAGKKLPTVQKKKSQNAGELRGKFAISSIKFQVSLFQWGWIKRLDYVIKFRLFTRKWHVMKRSLMWLNEI